MKNNLMIFYFLLCLFSFPVLSFGAILFQENFDDTNFSARGWYDGTYNSNAITNLQPYSGNGAYECHFNVGATHCLGGDPRRRKIAATDSVYVSFWLKTSSNWVGSGVAYHPHLLFLMTNLDGDYSGFYDSHKSAWIELWGLKPRVGFNDSLSIDTSNINVNLCNVSENRATDGCNGFCDSHIWDATACYNSGGWYNGREVTSSLAMTPNAWHHYEYYTKMNTISGGKGVNDGILQVWLDGQEIVNFTDLIIRTGQYPTAQWTQIALSPYIGDGSPIDQYLWIDNLTVSTSLPAVTTAKPSPPSNVQVQ